MRRPTTVGPVVGAVAPPSRNIVLTSTATMFDSWIGTFFLRSGDLVVKTFAADLAPRIDVMLDRSASSGPEGSAQARISCEIAGAEGFAALAAGGKATFSTLGPGGVRVAFEGEGPRDAERFLRVIEALPPPAGSIDWQALERRYSRRRGGTALKLISDFLASAVSMRVVAAWACAADATVYVVAAHESDADFDPMRNRALTDPETGGLLVCGGDRRWRDAYRDARAAHVAEVVGACAMYGVKAVAVSGREPFEDVLRAAHRADR